MYINYVVKLRRYIKKKGKETGKKDIYCGLSCLINTCTEQNKI